MHKSGHFDKLKKLKKNEKPKHYKRTVGEMLDVKAFEPIDAGGLLAVAWRAEPDEGADTFPDGSPYHGNIVRLTIPRLCYRIPDLSQYPDVQSRGGYGAQLVTLDDPASESGSLYLFVEAEETNAKAQKNLTIDTFHVCDTVKEVKHMGINGRPCATPTRTRAGLGVAKSNSPSDYITMVWDWRAAYAPAADDTEEEKQKKARVIETIRNAPATSSPMCMVAMLIPGGTIVWVPIRNKEEAAAAHRQLSDEADYPMFELGIPYYIDGPNIFLATCKGLTTG